MDLTGLLAELKHRKVFRVALIYSAVAWLVLQFADVITEPLVLAWAFDMTPEGVQRAEASPAAAYQGPLSLSQGLQMALIATLALLGYPGHPRRNFHFSLKPVCGKAFRGGVLFRFPSFGFCDHPLVNS